MTKFDIEKYKSFCVLLEACTSITNVRFEKGDTLTVMYNDLKEFAEEHSLFKKPEKEKDEPEVE